MKKQLALAITMILVLVLTACTGTAPTTAPAAPTTAPAAATSAPAANTAPTTAAGCALYPKVVAALDTDVTDLEPGNANGNSKSYFGWNVFESLYDYDENHNLIPDIASDQPVKVDDKTTDVKIFDKVYDTDGNNLTAKDVVYSFNWLIGTGNAIRFDLFDSVEAKDTYTVRFHWKQAVSSPNELEFPYTRTFLFTEKAWNAHKMASQPVGTGNYKVTQYTPGSKIILEAKTDYWGNDPAIKAKRLPLHTATVKTIEYQIIPEAAQAVIALETGTVDFANYIQNSMIGEFKSGPLADKYSVNTVEASDFYYLMPNASTNSPMQDINLRQAVFYATDNAAISKVMGGQYEPNKSIGTAYYKEYDVAWEKETNYITTPDAAKAKDYLSKSGYKGQELVLMTPTTEAAVNGATMIQTELAQIGIKIKIQSLDFAVLRTNTNKADGGWDMYFSMVGGPNLPGSFNLLFNNKIHDGFTSGFVKDDTLQAKFDDANSKMTSAASKVVIDYALQMAYMKPIAKGSTSIVANKFITKIYSREGYPTLPASTYACK